MADFETAEARSYNSPHFVFAAGVPARVGETLPARVGEPAPDFAATALDGQPVRLSDLRGKHVVMITGAVTSPMCCSAIPALNQLQDEFGAAGVAFFLLYTRESHPADSYPAHTTRDQKVAHARQLQRLENVRVPIVVDDLAGTIHRSYGPWPAALFVIDRGGQLVYRSNMANAKELRQLLEDLLFADAAGARGEILHTEYSERLIPYLADQATHRRVYERAGPMAFEEFWQRRPELRNRWP
jgi:alkyl hydroperoxide reductase subunit AhpC